MYVRPTAISLLFDTFVFYIRIITKTEMIQRIQTLFLILAILLNVAGLFLPLWSGGTGDTVQTVTGLSVEESAESVMFMDHAQSTMMTAHTAFVVLAIISSVWLLVVVFQFNDRPKQMRWTFVGMLMICVQILALVLLTMQIKAAEAGPEFGGLAPVLALVFAWLAARRIKKDEDLVRSVDRIR